MNAQQTHARPSAPPAPAPQDGAPARAILHSAGLALCVAASGAAVMIYEFLAVRFLQRFFGGSLDVWGSVVAVCLGALSLGYFIGGAVADRRGSWRLLGLALFLGGIAGASMLAVANRVGERLLQVDWGLAWHPHIAALASAFLPILALGTVFPIAIRLQTRRLDRVGAAAGWIAAISTLGSIAGVLATTMLLLPHYGVRKTLYATSVCLLVLGFILMALPRRRVAAAGLVLLTLQAPAGAEVVFEDYSAYHHIIVEDGRGSRQLRFDSAVQSTMSLEDPYAGGFEYTDFFHVPMLFDPTLDSALFLGLGGGSGPKSFLKAYPKMKIVVAEIDPMVLSVARKYFELPRDPRLHVVIEDGRTHLQRHRGTYGIIVADAYASGPYGAYLPYYLATLEFFQLAWNRLPHGGSMVYNIIGVAGAENGDMVRDIRTTMAKVFQAVYTFEAASSRNTVLVAVRLDPEKLESGPKWPQGPWVRHPLANTQLPELVQVLTSRQAVGLPALAQRVRQLSAIHNAPFEGRILTDDYAPVDLAPGGRRR